MDDPDPSGNLGDDLEEIGTVIEDEVQSQEKANARVNVRILFLSAT